MIDGEHDRLIDFQLTLQNQSANGTEQDRELPSREDFMDPDNAEGLLALSDPRTNAHTDDMCAICQDDMSDPDEAVVIVVCGHIYHRSCLLPWFETNTRIHTCPYCREELFVEASQQAPLFDGSSQQGPLFDLTYVPTIPTIPTGGILPHLQFDENPLLLHDPDPLLRNGNEVRRLNEWIEMLYDQEARLQLEAAEAQYNADNRAD